MSGGRDRRHALLIDASPYLFRAYFALPASITDRSGRPSQAVYGFADFMFRTLAEQRPTHVAVAFDASLQTSFRNELYPEYKAQRELPPAELEAQIDDCRALAQACGAAVFASERYEADDYIAALRARLGETVDAVTIVSSDKDLMQLVDERTTLLDAARGKRYDRDAVVASFGVEPSQIGDYLALTGDAVDNIPGVAGIGPKTAVALLETRRTLEAVYDDLDAIEALPIRGARSVRSKLEAGLASARLSRRLVTLAEDAPLDIDGELAEALAWGGPDSGALDAWFERLGFQTLRDRVPAAG